MQDPSEVRLIAASVSDNDKNAEVNITISDSITLLKEGDYAFYYDGDDRYQDYNYVWVAAAGRFNADRVGNITDGMLDINIPCGILQSVPFTGIYWVAPNRRGGIEIATAEGDFSYLMTVDRSGTGGKFISNDFSTVVSGYLSTCEYPKVEYVVPYISKKNLIFFNSW